MAIPLEGRLWWRRTAPFHVQLELEKARDLVRALGETQVRGLAVRVFRTDGRLSAGDRIEFPLWVCRTGDEPTGPAFIYEDAFSRAEYIEAYLAGTPPKCQLAAYEFCVLDAPSDRPVLTPEQLEQPKPPRVAPQTKTGQVSKRRTWQFWKRTSGA
jgi:hypothetical protein